MIKKIEIDCCRNCPFYSGSNPEFPTCIHPIAEKRGYYNNIVSRSHFKPDPIPKWCPIKNTGYTQVKRDVYDKVIDKTDFVVVGKIEL